ncbi:hypothetical protein ACF05T_12780 [Streptomyces lateritius]|uniref:Uncharacterized protein n=1 Tax=Streptomyces lateritius TaxID=67313 RepID=A0ABW6YAW1_9ACTN
MRGVNRPCANLAVGHFDDLAGPLREWLSEHATAGDPPPGRMAEALRIVHVD